MLRIVRSILPCVSRASSHPLLKIVRSRFALQNLYLESFRVALLFIYQGTVSLVSRDSFHIIPLCQSLVNNFFKIFLILFLSCFSCSSLASHSAVCLSDKTDCITVFLKCQHPISKFFAKILQFPFPLKKAHFSGFFSLSRYRAKGTILRIHPKSNILFIQFNQFSVTLPDPAHASGVLLRNSPYLFLSFFPQKARIKIPSGRYSVFSTATDSINPEASPPLS